MSALSQRCIVVSGVTSGIGKATVDVLLSRGARVIGIARNEAALTSLASGWGPEFVPVVADLALESSRARALVEIASAANVIDAIVNNAAECLYETPLATSLDTWRRLLEVNVLAALHLVQGLRERLRAFGHVVNISSVNAGAVQNIKFATYGLTKSALDQLTHALRLELAAQQIRVCLVTPGLVDTEIYGKVEGFERVAEKLRRAIPKWLEATDVAEAIAWILAQPRHVVTAEIVLLPTGQAL